MNLVPLLPFLGRGNVGTPWRVRSKGDKLQYPIMASSHIPNTSWQSERAHTEVEAPHSGHSGNNSSLVTRVRWFIVQGTDNDTPISTLSVFILEKLWKLQQVTWKLSNTLRKATSFWRLLRIFGSPESVSPQTQQSGVVSSSGPHRTVYTSKRVVYCKELLSCTSSSLTSVKAVHTWYNTVRGYPLPSRIQHTVQSLIQNLNPHLIANQIKFPLWEFEFSLTCRLLASDEKTLYNTRSYQHCLNSSIVLKSTAAYTHFVAVFQKSKVWPWQQKMQRFHCMCELWSGRPWFQRLPWSSQMYQLLRYPLCLQQGVPEVVTWEKSSTNQGWKGHLICRRP